MKKQLFIILTLLSSTLFAAGKLEISGNPSSNILKSGLISCVDTVHPGPILGPMIPGPSTMVRNFTVAWTSTNALVAEKIVLEITDPALVSGQSVSVVENAELKAVLGRDMIFANSIVFAGCPPIFGNIQFVDPVPARTVKGIVTFHGAEITASGVSSAVSASMPMTLNYLGKPKK